jgi:hypothetical protein
MRDVGHLPKNLIFATQGLSWIQNWTQFYKKDVILNAMTEKAVMLCGLSDECIACAGRAP